MNANSKLIVREFLGLPPEALAGAYCEYDPDYCVVWEWLRAYVKGQPFAGVGETVVLSADRDNWRDGVRVRLI